MKDCLKWLSSFPPFRRSMACPYCERLEWRQFKTIEEFGLTGCMRCRLIMENDFIYNNVNHDERKDLLDYKASGRYS